MESIKHKMDSMKKEEIAAIEKAAVFVKVFKSAGDARDSKKGRKS